MLAHLLLAAGILLLVLAGYKVLVAAKAAQNLRKRRQGLFSLSCAGDCGSAFEFTFKIENGHITQATARGASCAHSLICAQAAAALAKGKTLAQAAQITPGEIAKKAGGLDASHMHCAVLAAHGLAKATGEAHVLTNKKTQP